MKMMLVMPSFRGGGAERIFIDLAHVFTDNNYDVTLVALSGDGEYASSLPDNLTVKTLGKKGAKESFSSLVTLFRQEQPTVVISALTHLNILVVIACLRARIKAKVLVTEHNPYGIEKKALSSLTRAVMYLGSWVTYRLADRVVAVSNGVKASLKKSLQLSSKQVDVIYNPINIKRACELAAAPATMTVEENTIVTMGRLVPQKRHDLLIHALSQTVKQGVDVNLLILGDGPLKDELMALAHELGVSDRVTFAGFQSNPFNLMAQAKVFALASDFEGFGNVLVEALALGLPVISTDCECGPSEILDAGKYGVLVPVGNVEKLSEAMVRLLSGSHEFLAKGQSERANNFSSDVAFQNYQSLIRGELDEKAG